MTTVVSIPSEITPEPAPGNEEPMSQSETVPTAENESLPEAQTDLIAKPASDETRDRKSTRLNSSHSGESRMPSSA